MTKNKRLFLFAGFDKDKIVDNTVIYYVNALSKLGDIVFVADNDLSESEIKKLSNIPNVLHVGAGRHGEYDFGSYKRAYLWAKDKKILKNYDRLYFVNDSVYGPFNDLNPVLLKLENSGADLVGMAANRDEATPVHVQSWFIGFNKKIFTSEFFDSFMQKITRIPNKMNLVLKYEAGLTALIMRHGFTMSVILKPEENNLYGDPRQILIKGVPFVKKAAISKIRKMCFLYPHTDDDVLLDYVAEYMNRHNVVFENNSYYNYYEFRFFGIPLLRITTNKRRLFKIYLFGCIPMFKVIK
jgi:lipopolysaccharide biosynthesis protein